MTRCANGLGFITTANRKIPPKQPMAAAAKGHTLLTAERIRFQRPPTIVFGSTVAASGTPLTSILLPGSLKPRFYPAPERHIVALA